MATAPVTMILALSLTGFLPAGCSNMFSSKTEVKSAPVAVVASVGGTNSAVAVDPNDKDLGVVNLTNHCETTVDLGAGRSCRLISQMVDRKNLQVTLTLETRQADGQVAGLNVMQVVTRPGKPFDVSIGDLKLTLTPNPVE